MSITSKERFERAEEFEALVYSKFKDKRTQCEFLLEYLDTYGSITPLEALQAFGCFRLSARISDLKAQGYDISTEITKGDKNYAIYTLKGEDNE